MSLIFRGQKTSQLFCAQEWKFPRKRSVYGPRSEKNVHGLQLPENCYGTNKNLTSQICTNCELADPAKWEITIDSMTNFSNALNPQE